VPPWRTPVDVWLVVDNLVVDTTWMGLLIRVFSIHCTRYLGASSRISWCISKLVSTRSNAIDRSRERRAIFLFRVLCFCILFTRLWICVQEECPGLNANCSGATLFFSESQF
jgi:hypothetical protein